MALTYVFSGLSNATLTPSKQRTTLRFRLVFGSSQSHQETVQFEVAAADAVKIYEALQRVLTEQGWHSSPSQHGKPHLTIVSSDEET
jgi:hypothetical protein